MKRGDGPIDYGWNERYLVVDGNDEVGASWLSRWNSLRLLHQLNTITYQG